MSPRIGLALAIFTLTHVYPGDGEAQLYKWVDEKGVVNYADKPPPGRKAQPVGETSGSVTVVPGMPREEIDRQRERDTRQRLRQLEDEVRDLRAREGAREPVPPEPAYNQEYLPAYGYSGPAYRRPGQRSRGPHYEPPPEPNPPLRFEPPPQRPARAARSVQR